MTDYIFINDQKNLSACCEELASSQWLAIDTEFERINTYYPKLCLVQLSNHEKTVVVDPLAIKDIQPLLDLLYQQSIVKVLHSAHQDIEIFFNISDEIPQPLFDTQLAAPLFGFYKGMGYAKLIEEALDVVLDKDQARTDWTRRPLSDKQLRYAANDVIYLGQVYELFLKKIHEVDGKQLDELFSVLYQADTYHPDPGRMWKKIFAVRRLKGKPLNAAKQLAAWRELAARKNNLPRKWVLADQALVDLAKRMPDSLYGISTINKISEKMVRRYGEEWLAILSEFR